MGRVLLKMIRTLEDVRDGDEAWVEETPYVTGLVAGGYAVIVDRESPRPARKVVTGGEDQAQSR